MENDDILSTKIISLSNSAESTFFVSTISFWEMSIKIQLGKLSTKIPLDEIYKITEDIGIKTLGLVINTFQSFKNYLYFIKILLIVFLSLRQYLKK